MISGLLNIVKPSYLLPTGKGDYDDDEEEEENTLSTADNLRDFGKRCTP